MASKTTSISKRVQNAAKVMKITEEYVWAGLFELGIEENDLSLLEAETTREGDARRVFVDNAINIADKPSVKVKPACFTAGWAILKGRGKSKDSDDITTLVKTLRPISSFKDREILEQYNKEPSGELINELLKRSNNRPCIIYMPDGETVDIDNSIEMLRTARRREISQCHGVVRNGKTVEVRVYRADEFPMMWLEECPLHVNVVLTNGYCDRCGESWTDINEADRVIVRVAKDVGAAKDNLADIHELVSVVRRDTAKGLLAIPKVDRRYEELCNDGDLPKLKKRLSLTSKGCSDPLYQHRNY
jgi:hypothetical protein